MTLFSRITTNLVSLWRQRSLLTRLAVCGTVLFALTRRILWLFSTPHGRADIPRAVAVLDLFLAASYLELAGIACLFLGLVLEMRRRHLGRRKAL